MTFKLTENIDEEFKMSTEKFLSALELYSTTSFQLFPDKPLTGKIIGRTFSFKINPPLMWADIARSKVDGEVLKASNSNRLKLKITPSWTLLTFLIIWFFIIVLFLSTAKYHNINETFINIFWALTLVVIPVALTKLKIVCDTKRLKNLIDGIIKNGA